MKPRRLRPARVKAATARREAWRLQALMLAVEREADAIVRQRAAWGAYAQPAADSTQRAGQAREWSADDQAQEQRESLARWQRHMRHT